MSRLLPADIPYEKLIEMLYLDHSWLSDPYDINPTETKKGANGFIGVIPQKRTLYIYFNPTESWFNWVTNFNFRRAVVPYKGMDPNSKIRVHRGWVNLYSDVRVRDAVHKYILDHDKYKNIVVIGFSMGAAIATLCALDIQFNFPEKNVSCYAFGSPKVGNIHFVESFNKRVPDHYMIWNGNDIVCRVPPTWTALFNWVVYQHVNNLIRIGRKPVLKVLGKEIFFNPISFAVDHLPSAYYLSLLRALTL